MVAASKEWGPLTCLHLIATVGTVIWSATLITDLELRLVNGHHDCELVLVPIFLALVLVLMSDGAEFGRDAAETERIVLFEAVGGDPRITSEIKGLTSCAAGGRAYPFAGRFHALWPGLCKGIVQPSFWR